MSADLTPVPAAEPWLVALDVDGTILDYRENLSPAVAAAVTAVRAAGHHVVLATGRSIAATVPVARRLGLRDGWAVCSNGAVTAHLTDDEPAGFRVAHLVTFDPGPAIALLRRHLPDALYAVEEVGVGFRMSQPFPPGELTGRHTIVPVAELAAAPVTRLVVRSPGHTTDEFDALIAQVGLADVTYAVGWTAWMDVAPQGVTKASALATVAAELGVGSRTLAVGDGNNDVEMVAWATRGVAMGHAPVALLAAADEVTGTIDDDGLATVLRSLPGVDPGPGPVAGPGAGGAAR